MRMRIMFRGWIAAMLALVCLTGSALAGTYTISQDGTGNYLSLEALRQATLAPLPPLGNGIRLVNGDTIVLNNNDSTLTDVFTLPGNAQITIRSAGSAQYTVTGATGIANYFLFDSDGTQPRIVLNNIRIADNTLLTGGAIYLNATSSATPGVLNISNSLFENNPNSSVSIFSQGSANITITNTEFKNNAAGTTLLVTNNVGDTTNINLVVDGSAPRTVVWDGAGTGGYGIYIDNNGQAAINASVAYGKNLDIYESIYTTTTSNYVTLTKTGGGVMKMRSGGGGNMNVSIQEGTLQFGNATWTGNTISVGSQGVFKLTADPGNLDAYFQAGKPDSMVRTDSMSRFYLNSFQSQEGARLEIGNISMYPLTPVTQTDGATTWTYGNWVIIVPEGTTQNSTFASTMNINNKLLRVIWKSGATSDGDISTTVDTALADKDVWFPHIEMVNNLAVLDGVGSYADIYRKLTTLTQEERDALDHVYAMGAADGDTLSHLQTIGGVMVNNSMVAMRTNWSSLWRNINRRLTKFQREELEPEVTGNAWCYTEENPVVDYGEIWAYIDQAWHSQDDVQNIAGYDYNPYGIAIGYEKHMDEWIFGAVARYDGGDMKLKANHATRTEVDTMLLSAYASWASEGYYFTGGLHIGHGWNNTTSSYTMPGLVATGKTGDYGTNLYGVSAEGGYMMSFGSNSYPFRVTPYGGLSYARITKEGTTETGAGTLDRNFSKADWDMWELTAGVRFSMPIECNEYLLIPSADIAFVRTMGTPGANGNDVTLLSNPAGSWKTEVMGANRSALRVSAGLNTRFGKNWAVGVGYDFEWRKRGVSNQFNLNMTKGF